MAELCENWRVVTLCKTWMRNHLSVSVLIYILKLTVAPVLRSLCFISQFMHAEVPQNLDAEQQLIDL